MNPYLIIVFLLAILGAGAGGFKLGSDHEIAAQSRELNHIAEAVDAANSAAAQAIATLKPKFTTIQNEVQREVITKTIYSDCRHSPDGLRLANQALNGGTVPAGGGELPQTNPPK
jgi:uncharacterized protein HemX